jgi:hypothetical protein
MKRLHDLYSSPSVIRTVKTRRMRWEGHIVQMGDMRTECRLLVRKPEGKRPRGRKRRRWVDNIKMVLIEIKRGGVV